MSELEEKLRSWLEGLESRAASAEQLVASEIPAFIAEYLSWSFVSWTLYTLLWLVAGAVSLMVFWRCRRTFLECNARNASEDDKALAGVSTAFVVIAFAVSVAVWSAAARSAMQVLKITVAPRVYLVENLKDFLTKESN